MGNYSSFAQRLDEDFKAARDEYAKSWETFQEAKNRFEEAGRWHSGETQAERELNTAKAKIAFIEAQTDFETKGNAAWAAFNEKRAELRRGLEKEVRAASLVDPDAIDQNAIKLMESGIMGPDDYYKLVEKFDSNSTMTRLIARYAKAAAEDTDDRKSRAAFNEIALTCADGLGSVMRAWDGLSKLSDYCSGQSHVGRRNSPEQVIAMGRWWEELSQDTVKNF